MTAPPPLRALGALLLAGLLAAPSPALAWSNGHGGPDAYGTHDRVLDLAIDIAGRHARWVCRRAALRATDDPDVRAGIDHASGVWWHVYDRWGPSRYGNAPEAVAVWFRKARAGLRDGNRCGASRALGIMSHMLADVAQPMHTDQTRLEERVHADYESAVDARCAARATCRYGARSDGRDPAKPYGRTVALARRAHEDYAALVRRYARHGVRPGRPPDHAPSAREGGERARRPDRRPPVAASLLPARLGTLGLGKRPSVHGPRREPRCRTSVPA